jgi:hypothetical protein
MKKRNATAIPTATIVSRTIANRTTFRSTITGKITVGNERTE